MKFILLTLALTLFFSCGKDDSEDKTPPLLEVTNLTVTPACITKSTISIALRSTLGSSSEIWTVIYRIKEGDKAPENCKTSDKEATGTASHYFDMKSSTVYSMRACAVRSNDGYQSEGVTKTIEAQDCSSKASLYE